MMTKLSLGWFSVLMCAALAHGQDTATMPEPGPDSWYDGLVMPSKYVQLNAPLDGILHSLPVEENQPVSKGDLVAEMDDRLQRAVVEAARLRAEGEAEVRRMRYAADEAQVLLERAVEAHAADAASEWEVRRAHLQLNQANAAVDAGLEAQELAKADLRLEQQRLEQYKLFAPFDGRVVRVEAEAGATLTRDDPLMALASLDPLEAQIYLSAELYGRLQAGAAYELDAGEPVNDRLVGQLKTIDPIIDSASGTFRCVFEIANPDAALPAGFTVKLVGLDAVDGVVEPQPE